MYVKIIYVLKEELWKKRRIMEEEKNYGRREELWKRRIMEEEKNYGRREETWKKRKNMERTLSTLRESPGWKRSSTCQCYQQCKGCA